MELKPKDTFFMARAISPAMLPKNCRLYYLIINWDVAWWKRILKRYLLKPFLSIAEVIANW